MSSAHYRVTTKHIAHVRHARRWCAEVFDTESMLLLGRTRLCHTEAAARQAAEQLILSRPRGLNGPSAVWPNDCPRCAARMHFVRHAGDDARQCPACDTLVSRAAVLRMRRARA